MKILSLLIISFLYLPSTLFADPSYINFPSDISWKTRQSAHFQIIFQEKETAFATRALKSAEKAYGVIRSIFPDAPDKTWIVLADFKDTLNGYALNFPYSHIVLFSAPPDAGGQLSHLDDWLYSVMLHELVHILHIYPARGLWKVARTIFGSWVVPNGMMPSHLHEGLATFIETEFTPGGRGKGATFKMYQRKAVESGLWGNQFAPLDVMDGTKTRWPGGSSAYFYGYNLYQELWRRKGAKGIYALTESYASNWPYFINGPLKEIYGLNYTELWKEIYQKTRIETLKEINEIKKSPLSNLKYLTQNAHHKWSVALSPQMDEVAFGAESPKVVPHIEILKAKTGKTETLDISGSGPFADLCWGLRNGSKNLFYLGTVSENGYSSTQIFVYSFKTKESLAVTVGEKPLEHIHRFSCNSETEKILAYQEEAGLGQVLELELPPNSHKANLLRKWSIPTTSWVSGLSNSKNNWIALREGLSTSIYQWPLNADPRKSITISTEVFNLREDSQNLYAIASIEGRREVWEFFPGKQSAKKILSFIGGVNSFDIRRDKWIVSSYEEEGYDIALATPTKNPLRTLTASNPNNTRKLASNEPVIPMGEVRSYNPIPTLLPKTWIPSLLFVPDGVQFGIWIPNFDLSQKHFYDIFGGYDSRGLAFANVNYNYRFGGSYSLGTGAYLAPSYLQISKTFFKRWGGSISIGGKIPYFPPTIKLSLLFNRLESSVLGPAVQSVGLGIDLSKSFGFPSRRLAISAVNGIKLSYSHALYLKTLGSSHDYYTAVGKMDSYVEAPWWKSSVFYMGSKLGYTEGSTFINSYFEGGGELLFYQGRGFFLNRGFVPGLFAGRRMFNINLEYRFPIARIDRGIGLWPGHLEVIHAALVADTTSFDNGVSSSVPRTLFKTFFTSSGLELKSDWKFFYYLPTQIRMGVYHGFGRFGESVQFTIGAEAGL